ncbi:uncharacterized protein LOC134529962 [Bacillus rossius redtenbacheri]|uniref:uncharacterized protein LOC134529962 n=1 Tax=Bacillus rossius redtenbacheri TaxID=93214 RepID=UPI002FDCA598
MDASLFVQVLVMNYITQVHGEKSSKKYFFNRSIHLYLSILSSLSAVKCGPLSQISSMVSSNITDDEFFNFFNISAAYTNTYQLKLPHISEKSPKTNNSKEKHAETRSFPLRRIRERRCVDCVQEWATPPLLYKRYTTHLPLNESEWKLEDRSYNFEKYKVSLNPYKMHSPGRLLGNDDTRYNRRTHHKLPWRRRKNRKKRFKIRSKSHLTNHFSQGPRPFRERHPITFYKNSQHILPPYSGFSRETHPYPQQYRTRKHNYAQNIRDIIKYMTDDVRGSGVSYENQFFTPPLNMRGIKFSGVYKYPNSKTENEGNEYEPNYVASSYQNQILVPSKPFNGHAYIADPFHAFKPTDPLEINHLASSNIHFIKTSKGFQGNSVNVGKSRNFFNVTNPNDIYFPQPPADIKTHPQGAVSETSSNNLQFPEAYTTAVYRPLGQGNPSSFSSYHIERKKHKPMSVMLDIQPMTSNLDLQVKKNNVESVMQTPQIPHKPYPFKLNSLLRNKFHPSASQIQKPHEGNGGYQIVVHLNLVPKNKNGHLASKRDVFSRSFHVNIDASP